jgi:molybdate transport system substrate-binding protein
VAEHVASGEVEVGFQLISEIIPVEGVELVGPLPPELQKYVEFTAGISASAAPKPAVREFVEFLKRPASREAMKHGGLDPLP